MNINRKQSHNILNRHQSGDSDGGVQGELWKPVTVPGWEQWYEVSNHGQVRHRVKKNILTPDIDLDGYARVVMFRKGRNPKERETTKIHRLVAKAWLPNPSHFPFVNHKDGHRGNNRASNLEWVSPRENNIHRHKVIYTPEGYQRRINAIDTQIEQLSKKKGRYQGFLNSSKETMATISTMGKSREQALDDLQKQLKQKGLILKRE